MTVLEKGDRIIKRIKFIRDCERETTHNLGVLQELYMLETEMHALLSHYQEEQLGFLCLNHVRNVK